MSQRYPASLKQQARELYAGGALSEQQVAEQLGVSKPTVHRWTHPEFEENERLNARKRKYRFGGTCVDCGTITTAVRQGAPAVRCRECQALHASETRRWTREAVIVAIKRWHKKYGYAPTATEWEYAGEGHPAISTIRNGPNPPFQTWSQALVAAGFRPYKHRRPGRDTTHYPSIANQKKREQRINALRTALQKGDHDGNRHGRTADHDRTNRITRTGGDASSTPPTGA